MTTLKSNVKKGSVLQINKTSELFRGCFVITEEVHSWGVRGYIPTIQGDVGRVRISWNDLVYVGEAPFLWEDT